MTHHPLTVAHLTALDLPPPAFIEAAAAAGFDGVGLRLIQVTPETPGYDLASDAALMRDTRTALASAGTYVHDIEFVKITPDTRVQDLLGFLDAGAELSARQVITAPYDPDLSRLADTLAGLDEAARERGLGTVLEFFPWTVVPDLDTCWRVVQQAGDHVGLLVDALHFDRSGSSLPLLAAIPSERLPFAHLCDAPVCPPYDTAALLATARGDRLAPGDGAIDLAAFIGALPAGIPFGLEVPMTAETQAKGAEAVLAHIYARTCRLLGQ